MVDELTAYNYKNKKEDTLHTSAYGNTIGLGEKSDVKVMDLKNPISDEPHAAQEIGSEK